MQLIKADWFVRDVCGRKREVYVILEGGAANVVAELLLPVSPFALRLKPSNLPNLLLLFTVIIRGSPGLEGEWFGTCKQARKQKVERV